MEKMNRDMAEGEFLRFAECGRIRLNGVRSEDDEKRFSINKERFIEEVMHGRIVVDDEGWPTVNLGDEYEFLKTVKWNKRPNGVDKCVMDRHMDKQVTGMYAWAASTTGVATGVLKKLDDVDFEVILAVQELF